MSKLNTYQEWRQMITKDCGLTLDKGYCEERITALKDDEEQSTKSFISTYGAEYRDQVIVWFEQALKGA